MRWAKRFRCAAALAVVSLHGAVAAEALAQTQTANDEPHSSRPALELGVSAGPTWSDCRADLGSCEGEIGTGWSVDVVVLGRFVPYLAIGGMVEQTRLPWEAKDFDFVSKDESIRVFSAGVLARVYPLAAGWADPWVGVALGIDAVSSSVSSSQCNLDPGPMARLGIGFDAYAVRWLRASLSGFVQYNSVVGECTEMFVPNDPPVTPTPSPMFGLGLGLTVGSFAS